MSCERIWPAGAREQCLLSMVIHCVESVRGGEKTQLPPFQRWSVSVTVQFLSVWSFILVAQFIPYLI